MELTRNIIDRHKTTHEQFEYYFSIIEKIEENVKSNPDIAIESSKALIEGVSKTILLRLESSYTPKKVNSMDFPELFKKSCLSINCFGPFETDFVHRTTSMITRMAELRNERGDISHGKATPKEISSAKESAVMIMHVTDSIVAYILKTFFKIDLSHKEEVIYDENPDFNEMLDENFSLADISYSKALYDQDNIAYIEQLQEYLDSEEIE